MTKKSLLLSILVVAALVGCQKAPDATASAPPPTATGGNQVKTTQAAPGAKGAPQGMSAANLKVGGGDSGVGAKAAATTTGGN